VSPRLMRHANANAVIAKRSVDSTCAAMELLSRLAPAEFGKVWRSEPVPSQETAIPVQFFLPDGTEVPYDKLPKTAFPVIRQPESQADQDEDTDHDDVPLRQLRRNGHHDESART